MNSIPNQNDNLIKGNYYWVFHSEIPKISKIINITSNIIEYNLCELFYDNDQMEIIEYSDKCFSTKDRNNFKYFEDDQLDPDVEDLSSIKLISYPAILYNLKFKSNDAGNNFLYSGRLLIGVNIVENFRKLDNYEKVLNCKILLKIDEYLQNSAINQSILINGVPLTGKSLIAKYVSKKIINLNYSLFEIVTNLKDYIDLFGNTVVNEQNLNSTRYMSLVKFYFANILSKRTIVKIKFFYFLFENNRITNNLDKSYKFHIIHSIIEGIYLLLNTEDIKIKELYKDLDIRIIKLIRKQYSEIKEFIFKFRAKFNLNKKFYLEIYLNNFLKFIKINFLFKFHEKFLFKHINFFLSILFLSDIDFSIDTEAKCFIKREENDKDNLFYASKYLDCDIQILKKRLISREIMSPRGSFYIVKFTKDEAIRAKNSMIKYLYENNFVFVHNIVNFYLKNYFQNELKINCEEEYSKLIKSSNYIQIIECFALENDSKTCQNNSLENLFTNFTNDKLSNLLFDCIIKNEAKLYESEGVDIEELKIFKEQFNSNKIINIEKNVKKSTKINYNKNNGLFDNELQNNIMSCEDRTKGIFKLLDTQSSISNGTFRALCDGIKLNWPSLITTNSSFFLLHFGEYVEYGSNDFIQKNIDSVHEDLKNISFTLFSKITTYMIRSLKIEDKILIKFAEKNLMKNLESKKNENNSIQNITQKDLKMTRRFSQNMKLNSNSDKFLTAINNLIVKVKETSILFVKLIRTSQDEKDISNFNDKFVLKQIYSSGIIESCILAKGGCLIRVWLNEIQKLRMFSIFKGLNEIKFYDKIASIIDLTKNDILIGKTMFFIKNKSLKTHPHLRNLSNNLIGYIKIKIFQKVLNKLVITIKLLKHIRRNLIKLKNEKFLSKINDLIKRFYFDKIIRYSHNHLKKGILKNLISFHLKHSMSNLKYLSLYLYNYINSKIIKSYFFLIITKLQIRNFLKLLKILTHNRSNKIIKLRKTIKNFLLTKKNIFNLKNFIIKISKVIEKNISRMSLQYRKLFFLINKKKIYILNKASYFISITLKRFHLKLKSLKNFQRIIEIYFKNYFLFRLKKNGKCYNYKNKIRKFLSHLIRKSYLALVLIKCIIFKVKPILEISFLNLKINSLNRLKSIKLISKLLSKNILINKEYKESKIFSSKLNNCQSFISIYPNYEFKNYNESFEKMNLMNDLLNNIQKNHLRDFIEKFSHFSKYKLYRMRTSSNLIKKMFKYHMKPKKNLKQFCKIIRKFKYKFFLKKLEENSLISSPKTKKIYLFENSLLNLIKKHYTFHSFHLLNKSFSKTNFKNIKINLIIKRERTKELKFVMNRLTSFYSKRNSLIRLYKIIIQNIYFLVFSRLNNVSFLELNSILIKKSLNHKTALMILIKNMKFQICKTYLSIIKSFSTFKHKIIKLNLITKKNHIKNFCIIIKKFFSFLLKNKKIIKISSIFGMKLFRKFFNYLKFFANLRFSAKMIIQKFLKRKSFLLIFSKKINNLILRHFQKKSFLSLKRFSSYHLKIIESISILEKCVDYINRLTIKETFFFILKRIVLVRFSKFMLRNKLRQFFLNLKKNNEIIFSANQIKKFFKSKVVILIFSRKINLTFNIILFRRVYSFIKSFSIYKFRIIKLKSIYSFTLCSQYKNLIIRIFYSKFRNNSIKYFVKIIENLKKRKFLFHLHSISIFTIYINKIKKFLKFKSSLIKFTKKFYNFYLTKKMKTTISIIKSYSTYISKVSNIFKILNKMFIIKHKTVIKRVVSFMKKAKCLDKLNNTLKTLKLRKFFKQLDNISSRINSSNKIKKFLKKIYYLLILTKKIYKTINLNIVNYSMLQIKYLSLVNFQKSKLKKFLDKLKAKLFKYFFELWKNRKFLQSIFNIYNSVINSKIFKNLFNFSGNKIFRIIKIQKCFRNNLRFKKIKLFLFYLDDFFNKSQKLRIFQYYFKFKILKKLQRAIGNILLRIKSLKLITKVLKMKINRQKLNFMRIFIKRCIFYSNIQKILLFLKTKSNNSKFLKNFYLVIRKNISNNFFNEIKIYNLSKTNAKTRIKFFLKYYVLKNHFRNNFLNFFNKLNKINIKFFFSKFFLKLFQITTIFKFLNKIYMKSNIPRVFNKILSFSILKFRFQIKLSKFIRLFLIKMKKVKSVKLLYICLKKILSNKFQKIKSIIDEIFFSKSMHSTVITRFFRKFFNLSKFIKKIKKILLKYIMNLLNMRTTQIWNLKNMCSSKITKLLKKFNASSLFIKKIESLYNKIYKAIIKEYRFKLIFEIKKRYILLSENSKKITKFIRNINRRNEFFKKVKLISRKMIFINLNKKILNYIRNKNIITLIQKIFIIFEFNRKNNLGIIKKYSEYKYIINKIIIILEIFRTNLIEKSKFKLIKLIKNKYYIAKLLESTYILFEKKCNSIRNLVIKDIKNYVKIKIMKNKLIKLEHQFTKLQLCNKFKQMKHQILINSHIKKLIKTNQNINRKIILQKYLSIYLKKVLEIIILDNVFESSISVLNHFFRRKVFDKIFFRSKEFFIIKCVKNFVRKFRLRKHFKTFSKVIQRPFRLTIRHILRRLKVSPFLDLRNFLIRSLLRKIKSHLFEIGYFVKNLKLGNKRYLNDEMFSIKYSEMAVMMDYMSFGKDDKNEDNINSFSTKNSSSNFNIKKDSEEINKYSKELKKRNTISKFK